MHKKFQIHADEFKGPPTYTHLYPGERPSGSYVLSHDIDGIPTVYSLYDVDIKKLGKSNVNVDGEELKLNKFLTSRGKTPVEDRIPTLNYGSNVNPMQLVRRKFDILKHGDNLPNIDVVAVKGQTSDYSVVYMSRVASYGSVGAKIIPSRGEIETWLLLLDPEQLFRMHETEGVKKDGTGTYKVGIQLFREVENNSVIPVYGYLGGKAKVYIEPSDDLPVRFASRDYRGQSGDLVPNIDFIPIDGGDERFYKRAEIEMMELYNDLVERELKFPLFEWSVLSNGDKVYGLTEIGNANQKKVNEFLADYGKDFPIDIKFVNDPFDMDSFKPLKHSI